jgi:6-phospho-beta-glucosidase
VKIAVIGGAGVRSPLLVGGLTTSDLPIEEIALYDIDHDRQSVIGAVAARMAARGRVRLCRSAAECIESADFVFTSIRVGGLDQRVRDEAAAQRHGIAGQETVGPAGFAMAMRTIPHMVGYARQIAEAAPRAWIINFTNPVGIVTEAMRSASDRVIGICDTPTELFDNAARALDAARCSFDYFGLNHLGWLREVYLGGEPQLHRLWSDPERLRAVYTTPLFDPAALRRLKLLPTEYVYYYDQPTRAFENVRRAGRGRGQAVAELTSALFEALRDPATTDPVAAYRSYLWSRSDGYMQIESAADEAAVTDAARGDRRPGHVLSEGTGHRAEGEALSEISRRVRGEGGLSGYDRIALAVVRAIHFDAKAIVPLNVANRGNIPLLGDEDVVEIPCVLSRNGARALHVGRVPERIAPLLTQVKQYERMTIRAARTPSRDAAIDALAANPLVTDREAAARLVDDFSPLW